MEQLLIIDPQSAGKTRQRIARVVRVVQEADRLVIVEGSAEAIRKITALSGVTTPDALPAEAAAQLSPGERLFLDAWRRRGGMAKKRRAGAGLSWSAKGFRSP